jgi:hypothetical protein
MERAVGTPIAAAIGRESAACTAEHGSNFGHGVESGGG